MTINGITANTSVVATTSNTRGDALGQEDFLTLLVTQLRSQDPLNPMDSTEFTAQLAQFNSLDQLMSMNTRLESLLASQASMQQVQAAGLIGKSVQALGNSVGVKDGSPSDIHFELMEDAQSVTVSLYDENGGLARTIEGGPAKAGAQIVRWDGKNGAGETVPEGIYTYAVKAWSASDTQVAAQSFTEFRVTGVAFRDGIARLLSEGMEAPLSAVIRVMEEE